MTEETKLVNINTGEVISFDGTLDTLTWSDIREEIAPQGEHLMASDLIDQRFTLISMKRFPSNFEGQEYAYFCIGQTVKRKDLFNVVLGGGQPIQVLDTLYEAGIKNPVEFVLMWHDGGQYGGYYTLE